MFSIRPATNIDKHHRSGILPLFIKNRRKQVSKTVSDDNKQGFFWHVHHGILIEWCHGYDERAEYICTEKSPYEQETRLRLFQPVKGNLPEEVIEAWRAYYEAGQAPNEAGRAPNEASWQAYNEAGQAYREAVDKNMPAIKALHAEECPNCPWDGYTIFPKA